MTGPAVPAELHELDLLAAMAGRLVEQRLLCEVSVGATRLPVHAYVLGSPRTEAPMVAFIGGVHGLERIGA